MSVFRRLRWLYKKLRLRRLRYALPFAVLTGYTILGAYIFRHFELEPDELRRQKYRADTEYAFNQVLNRMMEVRCEDKLLREDQQLQARHTKDALFWLIDYLNLTQVLEERSESSPWTWPGAMFYAGQLYTTIGYGLPVAQTAEGRLASILYIMFGIPIFLLILAQVGKLLSRALRKIYKRLRTAKSKLPDDMTRKMSEPVKAIYSLTPSLLSNGGTPRGSVPDTAAGDGQRQLSSDVSEATTALAAGDESDSKRNLLAVSPQTANSDLAEEFDPDEQNQLNKELHNKNAAQQQQPVGAKSRDAKRDSSGAFPIPLALALLILWIAFSAAMFCLWETDWGYLTSVYFFFVSISTVGLGDIVPTKPDMMFINFMLILIGLALLSMCINLIQDALERLIEQLIEEYIDEIEKIAAVVTNNEEFAEEAPMPFEVGMTEMLTVPLTTIAQVGEKPHSSWRAVKDWMAERIASNVLMSRLDPVRSSDESSSSSESEDEAWDAPDDRLHRMEDGKLPLRAKVSVVSGASREEPGAVGEVPVIEVHEGTPVSSRASDRFKDAMSFSSERRRSRRKKRPTVRAAGALSNFSKSTMRAIQAIETAKMRTYRDGDFKSRLFAKFATNERLARLVDDHIVSAAAAHEHAHAPVAKMVSAGSQTTPPPAPHASRAADARLRSVYAARNFTLESMDSTSSDVGNNNTADWASNSAFDADSLYSAGYFDMSFGGYSTDSVPRLVAEPNTPQPLLSSTDTRAARQFRQNVASSQRYPFRSGGGGRLKALKSSASIDTGMTVSASGALPYHIPRSLAGAGTASVPGSPPMALGRRAIAALPHGVPRTPPITGPMPKISLTVCDAPLSNSIDIMTPNPSDQPDEREAQIPAAPRFHSADGRDRVPRPTPTPTSSPTVAHRSRPRNHSGKASEKDLPPRSPPPLLGSVPLHHRALSARRRFSDNDCLAPRATIAELRASLAGSRRDRLGSEEDDPCLGAVPPDRGLRLDLAMVSARRESSPEASDRNEDHDGQLGDLQHLRPQDNRRNSGSQTEDTVSVSSTLSDVVSVRENEDWQTIRQIVDKLVEQVSR